MWPLRQTAGFNRHRGGKFSGQMLAAQPFAADNVPDSCSVLPSRGWAHWPSAVPGSRINESSRKCFSSPGASLGVGVDRSLALPLDLGTLPALHFL